MQQAARHPRFPEQTGSAVQRIAFANRTQIEHDTLAGKPDREVLVVQLDQAHPGPRPRFRHLRRLGQFSSAAHEPPAAHEWPDRDVEGSVGCPAQLLRLLQQAKECRLHTDRAVRRARIQVADFTGGIVKAELPIEPLDFIQRLLRRGAQRHGVRAVEDNLEARRHRVASDRYGVHARGSLEIGP